MLATRTRTVLSVLSLRRKEFWEQSRWHRLARLGLLFSYGYLGVLVVLLFLENRFLYHPSPATDWWAPPAGLKVQDVELTSGGTALHAWWAAPPGWAPEQGAMLYCHGNAGNLSGRGESVYVWQKQMGFAVLIFDYPGYGRSAGKPSEAGCYAAGEAAYAWLTETKRIEGRNIVLYGGSLGGAIATELATHHPCRALVLLSAFSSFPDMAQKTFPFLPARWLVRNKFDNLGKIGSVNAPVFIGHGTADTMIPFTQGERLFAAAKEPKDFVAMAGQDHNEGPNGEFFQRLREFLRATGPK